MLSWKNTGLHDVSSVFLTIYKETDGVGLCLLFKCDRAEQILEQKLRGVLSIDYLKVRWKKMSKLFA